MKTRRQFLLFYLGFLVALVLVAVAPATVSAQKCTDKNGQPIKCPTKEPTKDTGGSAGQSGQNGQIATATETPKPTTPTLTFTPTPSQTPTGTPTPAARAPDTSIDPKPPLVTSSSEGHFSFEALIRTATSLPALGILLAIGVLLLVGRNYLYSGRQVGSGDLGRHAADKNEEVIRATKSDGETQYSSGDTDLEDG